MCDICVSRVKKNSGKKKNREKVIKKDGHKYNHNVPKIHSLLLLLLLLLIPMRLIQIRRNYKGGI